MRWWCEMVFFFLVAGGRWNGVTGGPQAPGIPVNGSADMTEPPQSLVGVAGTPFELPCNITAPTPEDSVALVLWYKDDSTTPLYSLDARRGPLAQARHAASDHLEGRAYLSITPRPSRLRLKPLLETDEGQYRCRVDFKKARTRNFDVSLTVIVPPKKPVIMDENGDLYHSLIGPYNEGDRLFLACEAKGGKPSPSLSWWRESVLLDDSFEVRGEAVRNEIEITSLQRHDLMAVYTCQAANSNLTVPLSRYVTVDMNFRPLEVSIEGDRRPLSAESAVELVCRATGSRPPSAVTWWKGGAPVRGRSKDRVSIDGYVTTSILIFRPVSEDAGKRLACRAENPLIPDSAIEDGWTLEVNYAPQLTLRLGSKLRHGHIQEGNDVYLECGVRASPPVTLIGWRFEGRELRTNHSAGVVVSDHSLVLQKVRRSARGKYTCHATNAEGTAESNDLFLRVQFAPFCRADQQRVYGAARHEPVRVSCQVEADPRQVDFRWQFNGSSAEALEVVTFVNEGATSTATYVPRGELDYGALLCWGSNEAGAQAEPCAFEVVPAGVPDPVENCTVSEQTEDSVSVECAAGYDGGLAQTFFAELHDPQGVRLRGNLTSQAAPAFRARGLPPGTTFVVVVYAANAKGRSQAAVLRTHTLPGPETQTRRDRPWEASVSPVLVVLLSVVIALVLVALIIILTLKFRRKGDRGRKLSRKKYMLTAGLTKEEEPADPGKSPGEEKGPDIIPAVGSFPAEKLSDEGLQLLSDASSLQLIGNGQSIPTISKSRQPDLPPNTALRDYSRVTPQKVLPMEETPPLQRHYVRNIQTDV